MKNEIDPECKALCDAINLIKGIRTIESCCGHGKDTYRIWFQAENLEVLPKLLYWFDSCRCGFYGWSVTVKTDCSMSPVSFRIEGPVSAYGEAEEIAQLLLQEQEG